MNNIDKLSKAIHQLQPNSSYKLTTHESNAELVDEALFNNIVWNSSNSLTWSQVQTKMNEIQTEYNSLEYARARELAYPITKEFIEAYTEKEIGGDSTKWDAYKTAYNKVRSDNPKS